ncbi:MAG: sulfurtransferase complex subunit TusC [Gammaproteobacteria bacterium]|nr:sulfurtransferase complex subunit TusC [Gammaproteobacteria bacterium]
MSDKLLFISRSPPYGSGRARALLELSLAAAVFEQDVDMLFLGDGVYQLLRDQDGAAIESKTLGNALEALELYGIERPGVEAAALETRGIAAGDLVIEVEPLAADSIRRRIAAAGTVFNL